MSTGSMGSVGRAIAALRRTGPGRLLLAYALLCVALLGNNGGFFPLLLPLPVLSLLLVIQTLRRPDADGELAPALGALPTILVCLWLISLARPPGEPDRSWTLVLVYDALTLGALLAALAVLRRPRPARVALLVGLQLLAGVLVLVISRAPRIDVFFLQQLGARDLLAGRDPYTSLLPNTFYNAEETRAFFGDDRAFLRNYPYTPLSLFATTLAYAAVRDVRAAWLLCHVGTGLLLYRLCRRTGGPPRLAVGVLALHLLHPRGLFVVEQSWTEPLISCVAVAFLLLLPRRRAATAALALFLAAKQYSVLLLPLLPRLGGLRLRALGVAALGAALLTVPLGLWHPRDFVEDVVLFQLRQPFRPDALSLPAGLYWLTGLRAPGALALVGAAAAAALGMRRAPAGPGGLALAAACLYLAFFLSAKQAFCNYYYFAGVLLLASLAAQAGARAASAGGAGEGAGDVAGEVVGEAAHAPG